MNFLYAVNENYLELTRVQDVVKFQHADQCSC